MGIHSVLLLRCVIWYFVVVIPKHSVVDSIISLARVGVQCASACCL